MKFFKKIKRYKRCWKNTRITPELAKQLTLYPDVPQKKISQIRQELFWLCRNPKRWSWSYEATIDNYFSMGIDREGEDLRHYVFRDEIDKARNIKQPMTCWILNDKWVTAQYLESCGVATTRPLFVKTPFLSAEKALEMIRHSGFTQFFAKEVDGSLGKGAFPFRMDKDSFVTDGGEISATELMSCLEGYIVEPAIDQHEALNALYSHAVSSCRIVTVCDKDKVEIILSSLFMGAGGTHMSNLYQGGMLTQILKNGELGEIAVKTKGNRGRYTSHPDSGIVFKGFKVPFWKEVTELAIKAHQCFPKIYSIGWDIAITKNGPIIIEGNRRWIPHAFQFVNGPGREYLKKWFTLRY